jgi:hypothetical protein
MMAESNIEEVLGASLAAVLEIVGALTDLMIKKGLLSTSEVAESIQCLTPRAAAYAKQEAMVRMLFETVLTRYQGAAAPDEPQH